MANILSRWFGREAEREFAALTAAAMTETKAATIPFVEEVTPLGWTAGYGQYGGLNIWQHDDDLLDTGWSSLVNRIYSINSAIGACCFRLVQGYKEPPPIVKVNGEVQPNHPLQKLLDRPNPQMSHAELLQFSIIYRVVGGNVYLHKVRSKLGNVVELWPFHAGQMCPVPSRFNWVEEFEYDAGKGEKRRVPAEDVIHRKTGPNAPHAAAMPATSHPSSIKAISTVITPSHCITTTSP